MLAPCVEESQGTIGPQACVANTDSRRHPNARTFLSRAEIKRRLRQVLAVEGARDAHRACKPPGAVESRSGAEAEGRFARPHQHGMTVTGTTARHVEAIVHSIDEKNVRVPFLSQKRPRAFRQSRTRVASEIARASVGLRLDDARHERRVSASEFMNDEAPDERPRNGRSVSSKPRPWQSLGPPLLGRQKLRRLGRLDINLETHRFTG